MPGRLPSVLQRLASRYGCVPKLVVEESNSLFLPLAVAQACAADLTALGVRIVDVGVWEYAPRGEPTLWGLGGPADAAGEGRFGECAELGWAMEEPAATCAETNAAAQDYLRSLHNSDAYRTLGDARCYVELFLAGES